MLYKMAAYFGVAIQLVWLSRLVQKAGTPVGVFSSSWYGVLQCNKWPTKERLLFSNFHFQAHGHSLQVRPSPVQPDLQAHTAWPLVLVQVASGLQPPLLVVQGLTPTYRAW